jgi:CDP-glucose 4,6-dehydratase
MKADNNFWDSKNVFVTGADGFIGSWVAKTLVEKNANVIVVVRDIKVRSNIDVMNLRGKVTIVQGDILDYPLMERVINEYDIDTVFHLAAQALVGIANKSPISTFNTNIRGTWNILEACRKIGTVKRIVVASSDKAYGVHKELPYTEEAPLHGLYPYDASKACADILSRSYFVSYGLPVAVTRNANTYGGGDMNFSRIIPDGICSTLKGKRLEIRSDGTPERDYMYIKDAVSGYLTLAEQLNRKEVQGQAFNFGTETPISVLDLFNKIIKLIGKDIKPKVLGTATNEIDRQYLGIEKVKKVLSWTPKYSLDEGLKETIEWYKEFLEKNPNR